MLSRTRSVKVWVLTTALVSVVVLTVFLSPSSKAKPAPGPLIRLTRATFDPLLSLLDVPADLAVIGPTGTRYDDNGLVASGALGDTACQALDAVTLGAPGATLVGWGVPFTATVASSTATLPVDYGWAFDVHQMLVNDLCRPLTEVTASADDPTMVGQPMHFQTVITPTDATQPVNYDWDFGAAGSGSGLNGPSPVFTYTETGIHTVAVTVTNCTNTLLFTDPVSVTYTFPVVVENFCEALTGVVASADDPVQLGQPMHFQTVITPTNAMQPINYDWDFGAAGVGSGLNSPSPVFTYTEMGLHNIVVTATNCARTLVFSDSTLILYSGLVTYSLQVEVLPACEPLVEVLVSADDPVPVRHPVHFQATVVPGNATPPIIYTWNFGAAGSGSGLNGPTPVFTYTVNGLHRVVVAAVNCAGAGSDITHLDVLIASRLFLPIIHKGW